MMKKTKMKEMKMKKMIKTEVEKDIIKIKF